MSAKLIGQVWGIKLSTPLRSLLMALADHANDEGVCFPGIDYLCWKLNRCERQVQKSLALLKLSGIVSVVKPGNGRGHLAGFKIDLTRGTFKPLFKEKKGGVLDTKPALKGGVLDTKGCSFESERVAFSSESKPAIRKNHIEPVSEPKERRDDDVFFTPQVLTYQGFLSQGVLIDGPNQVPRNHRLMKSDADDIAATVRHIELWERVLKYFLQNRYALHKLGNILDRYRNEEHQWVKEHPSSVMTAPPDVPIWDDTIRVLPPKREQVN